MSDLARLVDVGNGTKLYVVERGRGYPLIAMHGGPGLDHHEFSHYLDGLPGIRLILVDLRGHGCSTPKKEEMWTIPQLAKDIVALAKSLKLERYALFGSSFGSFVALQHAVDFPDQAAQTIVSGCVSSLKQITAEEKLTSYEPVSLRKQVMDAFSREENVQTQEEFRSLMKDQRCFHFANPHDPRIQNYHDEMEDMVYSPAAMRHFHSAQYGGFDLEESIPSVNHPVLICVGRHDRICPVEAAELMLQTIHHAELVIFEKSGHLPFVEENDLFWSVIKDFIFKQNKWHDIIE